MKFFLRQKFSLNHLQAKQKMLIDPDLPACLTVREADYQSALIRDVQFQLHAAHQV